jgi:hypothetical protein
MTRFTSPRRQAEDALCQGRQTGNKQEHNAHYDEGRNKHVPRER